MLPSSDPWFAGSTVRRPRLQVLANGRAIAGVTSVEVMNNAYFAADIFEISLALTADPERGVGWWANQGGTTIDIQVTLGGAWVNLVHGTLDSVEIDPLRAVARISGRDLSAGLIESRVQGTFANQTASEIASAIAGRHGLAADVQATTTPVGRYWQLEHDSLLLDAMARSTTEWDLLVALAQYEGFDVGVRGTTLRFRPPEQGAPPLLLEAANCTRLVLERSLTMAQGVRVTVRSWNSRAAQCYEQCACSPDAGDEAKDYIYLVPNLTPDMAAAVAAQRLAEVTRHERVLAAELPGETELWPGMQVLLQGTASSFDASYVIDVVERRIDARRGFSERLRAHAT